MPASVSFPRGINVGGRSLLPRKTDPAALEKKIAAGLGDCGAGMGRSKLAGTLIENTLGVRGTARNWNTGTRMLEIAESLET